MKSIRIRLCLVILLFGCAQYTWSVDKTKELKIWSDSARNSVGKEGFLPFHRHHIELARALEDTVQINLAYANIVTHYYQLGNVDSLKIASYDYMDWCEKQHKEVTRYQTWREYVQRLTEKGMQEEAIAETERLRSDAVKRKSAYGQACSEMCIGYNHRVFSNNVKLCLDYYNSALKLFEGSGYYEDAYVVYLNIAQLHLGRQENAEVIETLGRLERLTNLMKQKGIAENYGLVLRFYQFRVIATLADKGKKAAQKYIDETDRYYRKHSDSVLKDAWYGYKILCGRTLQDWKETIVYLDSLSDYNYSIGVCYPANHLFKAQCLETMGRLDEACKAYVEYAQLNDSVRTAEMADQLSKYTVQFEVNKLQMEKLELSAKSSRDRFIISLIAGTIILILLLILTYYYMRSLAMNKKLDAAGKAVVRASRMKSSFIQHITHEIRTPLNAIVGFSSLLAEGGLDEEEGREYSRQINSSNIYLLDLVNNVIDTADMDSQTEDMPKKAVDVNVCCEASMTAIRPLLKETVELQYSSQPTPLMVQGSPLWMERVLLILLNNANKFMDAGVIRLRYEEDKQQHLVRFIVEDDGPGIDAQYKEAIFERFYKIDNFTPGTGLGLAVAHQIMDLVGGRIYLDTTYANGARFVVEWPV